MNTDLVRDIHNSPFKKKYIAEKIGVRPEVLSMCIKGDRHLPIEKEEKLKTLLKTVS